MKKIAIESTQNSTPHSILQTQNVFLPQPSPSPVQQKQYWQQNPPKQKKARNDGKYQDGMQIFRLNNKFLKIQGALNLLWFLYFILLFSYYQYDVIEEEYKAKLLLGGVIADSLGIGVCSFMRYLARKKISLARMQQQQTTIFQIITQISLYIIQPYPWLNQIYIERISKNNHQFLPIKLNYILIIFALPKLIFLFRGLLHFATPYANPRYYRVGKIYGVQNNYFYHIRCLFKHHPVVIISVVYSISVFLFAYCFKILQHGADPQVKTNSLQNVIWLSLIIMTTVGYGDITPETRYGGYITLINSFIGVIGTSLFVLAITNNLQLNYGEQLTLQILKQLNFRNIQKIKSGNYIRVSLWRIWLKYKNKKKLLISFQQLSLKRQLAALRHEKIKYLTQSSLFQLSLQQQFQIVCGSLRSLFENSQILLHDLTKKNQVIEGVIHNLQKQKTKLQKNFNNQKNKQRKQSIIKAKNRQTIDNLQDFYNLMLYL